jgi:uncharacterized membrane protein
MFSSKAAFWGTDFHYSLAIAPVIAMGAADGLRNLLRFAPAIERRIPRAATVGAALMLAGSLLASAKISNLRSAVRDAVRGPTAAERASADAVRLIPSGASVGADGRFIPHLSHRRLIYGYEFGMPETDYILVDDPGPYAREARAKRARYTTIFRRDGVLVMKRNAPASTKVQRFNFREPAK